MSPARKSKRVVIVGGGQVGSSLARALATDHEVFVIDHDTGVADTFSSMDVEFILGSGTSEDVLVRADVEHCEFLVACTGLDEVNIVACAIANRIGNPQTICLVSRDDFLSAGGKAIGLEQFGIDRVLWPEAQLAADIERIVTAPGAIDAEVFAGGIVRLFEYRLGAGSQLITSQVSGLHLPRGSLIVAVKRAGRIFVPRGATRLVAGDKIIIMGTPDALRAVQALVHPGTTRDRQRVTIIGGGDVGFQLAACLETSPSIELSVVEGDPDRGAMLAARLSRTLVLNGDGTDLELLESERVGQSDVLVSVIDNDEKNLLASLLGRQLGVPKVITRVSRPANLRLFELVGIDVALSARGSAVASILHQITGGRASLLAVLEHGEARVIEITVPDTFEPRELKGIGTPEDAIVAAILRGDRAIVPRGDDQVEPGDRILVFSTRAAADRVLAYFGAEA
jgi:trk system potassium uptake protein TrkA